jgi:hypothetical protein
MINCRSATSLHTEASEGSLKGLRRILYGFHMRVCAQCRAYKQGLAQNDAALKGLPAERAPEELKRALAERLGKQR